MYSTKIPEEDASKYKKIEIDNKVFYFLKPDEQENKTPKRRYNEQFKDGLFLAKETYKKLNMIKKFNLKYKDIIQQTDKYISCIEEAIWILKKDYSIEPLTIFQSFNLKHLGFNPEDYGVNEDVFEDYDE